MTFRSYDVQVPITHQLVHLLFLLSSTSKCTQGKRNAQMNSNHASHMQVWGLKLLLFATNTMSIMALKIMRSENETLSNDSC